MEHEQTTPGAAPEAEGPTAGSEADDPSGAGTREGSTSTGSTMIDDDTADGRIGEDGSAASPGATPPPRRLVQRRDGAWVSGVAAGIAAYVDVNVWWVRAAFAVLATTGGIGVVVYVLAMLFLPRATPEEEAAYRLPHRPFPGGPVVAAILLIVIGASIVSDAWHGGLLVGLLLIGGGIYLLRDPGNGSTGDASFGVPVSVQDRVSENIDQLADRFGVRRAPPRFVRSNDDLPEDGAGPPAGDGEPAGVAPSQEAPSTAETASGPGGLENWGSWMRSIAEDRRARRRERRRQALIARLTVGVAVLTAGAALAMDRSGVADVALRQVLALMVAVLGAGLLVGAVFGRARSLIAWTLLLLPFLTASVVVGNVPLGHRSGDHVWRPTSLQALPSNYRMGGGAMKVDLSQLDLAGQHRSVVMSLGAGEMEITLPPTVTARVHARASIGDVDVPGVHHDGRDIDITRTILASGSETGTLDIDARVGVGELTIMSSSTTGPVVVPQQQEEEQQEDGLPEDVQQKEEVNS